MGRYLNIALAVPSLAEEAEETVSSACERSEESELSPRPQALPLDAWSDEAATALIVHVLSCVAWRWEVLPAEQRDRELQEYLADVALAPIAAARERRDMVELRRALRGYEKEAITRFSGTTAEPVAR